MTCGRSFEGEPSQANPRSLRLIDRTDVLQQLLAAIATERPGKLHLGRIRSALISQADVVKGIQTLITAGELDKKTLRPPAKTGALRTEPERPSESTRAAPVSRISGAALAEELQRYCATHGLALRRVSKHLFGGLSSIAKLRRKGVTPQAKTVERVRAFLSAPPPPGLEARPCGGPRIADNGGITGAELAEKIDGLIAAHGLSKTKVGQHLMGQSSGVETIRRTIPRRKTVAKIEAFLANPPIAELKAKVNQWDERDTRGTSGAQCAGRHVQEGGLANGPDQERERETPDTPASTQLTPPAATFLKPEERAWCEQCQSRRDGVSAALCTSPWCKLKAKAA